jgi:hypothetical protein
MQAYVRLTSGNECFHSIFEFRRERQRAVKLKPLQYRIDRTLGTQQVEFPASNNYKTVQRPALRQTSLQIIHEGLFTPIVPAQVQDSVIAIFGQIRRDIIDIDAPLI